MHELFTKEKQTDPDKTDGPTTPFLSLKSYPMLVQRIFMALPMMHAAFPDRVRPAVSRRQLLGRRSLSAR